jgi:hypothetical protein
MSKPTNTAFKWKAFGIAVLLIGLIALFANRSGIHPIGDGNAVYIAGEACTINMDLAREAESIRVEFEQCLVLHEQYKKNEEKK